VDGIQNQNWIRDGNMFSERHTAIGKRHDGTKTELVELCMGELAEDGRQKI
jgi:hypothetical protein